MREREIEKYGNELTISGVVMGNGTESEIIMFPGKEDTPQPQVTIYPNIDSMRKIIKQLDVIEITGVEKTILRKSQRNMSRDVNWATFRRDKYKCRYCGNDHIALTVDHVVTWESLGDSVIDNLITSCGKCNRTRGNMEYPEWLESPFYQKISLNLTEEEKQDNIDAWDSAQSTELRPRKRSR